MTMTMTMHDVCTDSFVTNTPSTYLSSFHSPSHSLSHILPPLPFPLVSPLSSLPRLPSLFSPPSPPHRLPPFVFLPSFSHLPPPSSSSYLPSPSSPSPLAPLVSLSGAMHCARTSSGQSPTGHPPSSTARTRVIGGSGAPGMAAHPA